MLCTIYLLCLFKQLSLSLRLFKNIIFNNNNHGIILHLIAAKESYNQNILLEWFHLSLRNPIYLSQFNKITVNILEINL